MTLNAGIIQDLYHQALAMLGETNGLDANTLRQRLDCAESAHKTLMLLDTTYFEQVQLKRDYHSEAELRVAGAELRNRVAEWATFHGIFASTGETNPIGCRVCGTPAMLKSTECYEHAFCHKFDDQAITQAERGEK